MPSKICVALIYPDTFEGVMVFKGTLMSKTVRVAGESCSIRW